nr:HEAT repeat domain-containing protein [uncultured Flavobacterium sp.]
MDQFIFFLKYYVIPFLLCSTISFIFLLIIKRIHYQYHNAYQLAINKRIYPFLIEIVLNSPNKEALKEMLSGFRTEIWFHRSWCKDMIINDLIYLKKILKGRPLKNITLIYKSLKLNKYSNKLIKDFRMHKKCEGFYHFQSLGYKSGMPLISQYLNHPNKIIRSNANIAYLAISKGDWYAVNTLPPKISILNTIKMMDVLYHQKLPMPEEVNIWITSENKTILKLAIMTMVFYNYRNKSAAIISLLDNDDIMIKTDVIIAIRELFLNEAENKLIHHLEFETTNIQLEILNSLAIIGSEKTTDYLQNKMITEPDTDLKLAMVYCLNKLNPKLLNQLGLRDSDIEKMIRHTRKIAS